MKRIHELWEWLMGLVLFPNALPTCLVAGPPGSHCTDHGKRFQRDLEALMKISLAEEEVSVAWQRVVHSA